MGQSAMDSSAYLERDIDRNELIERIRVTATMLGLCGLDVEYYCGFSQYSAAGRNMVIFGKEMDRLADILECGLDKKEQETKGETDEQER